MRFESFWVGRHEYVVAGTLGGPPRFLQGPLVRVSQVEASAILREGLRNHLFRDRLVRWLIEEERYRGQVDYDHIIEGLMRELRAGPFGRFVVWRINIPRPHLVLRRPEPISLRDLLPDAVPEPPPLSRPTWIEMSIVSARGELYSEASIEVRMPGGTLRTARLDSSAKWRADDIAQPGTCFVKLVGELSISGGVEPKSSSTHQMTLAQLRSGVVLATGQKHVLVVTAPVTCVRLAGLFFDTNKSFLLPSAVPGIRKLIQIYADHPGAELLIVGHTDRSGEVEYNNSLSLERAEAVVAYLTEDVDAWLKWYESSVPSPKRWGEPIDILMIHALPEARPDAAVKNTILWFQETYKDRHDLGPDPVDGVLGPLTRRAIITEYMALDGTTLPSEIAPIPHGCGESFPTHSSTNAGDDDPIDRRVELFVFDEGVAPRPSAQISGPEAAEYPVWQAAVTETIEMSAGELLVIQLVGRDGTPLTQARYEVDLDGVLSGGTTEDGRVVAMLNRGTSTGILRVWSTPDAEAPDFVTELSVGLRPANDVSGAQARLQNLGFGIDEVSGALDNETKAALAGFQTMHELPETSVLDASTVTKLVEIHGC